MERWLAISIGLGITLLMSMVTLCAFAWDKRAARLGQRRTRERTLHLLELLGGWPGALLAMWWVRHKSRDRSFQIVTAGSVVVHIGLWVAIFWLTKAH